MRILWLAFERPPHPDAVCHPATVGDVLFVLEWLEATELERQRRSGELRRSLAQQAGLAPWERPAIPCRRESGVYTLVPWRLAHWLSRILPATPGVLERTRRRLEDWLGTTAERAIVRPTDAA
jgi:hypothetical protein